MHKVRSESEVAQLCPTLCDPMDSSLPGSSVHGIFQARVLAWVAIAFSRLIRSDWLSEPTCFRLQWYCFTDILDIFIFLLSCRKENLGLVTREIWVLILALPLPS